MKVRRQSSVGETMENKRPVLMGKCDQHGEVEFTRPDVVLYRDSKCTACEKERSEKSQAALVLEL